MQGGATSGPRRRLASEMWEGGSRSLNLAVRGREARRAPGELTGAVLDVRIGLVQAIDGDQRVVDSELRCTGDLTVEGEVGDFGEGESPVLIRATNQARIDENCGDLVLVRLGDEDEICCNRAELGGGS